MSSRRGADDVLRVGIAIGESGPRQYHVGILHRGNDSDELEMLHLAWHCDLRNETPSTGYLWLKPGVNPRRLKQVAASCRLVWKRNQKGGIPFGFSPPNNCFDADTGRYLFGPSQHGLTCATFVLGVFGLSGLKLVDYLDWPTDRPGDSAWQYSIVDILAQRGAAQDHIDAISEDVGVARFRPEEVAGASLENTIPVSFETAVRRGGEVLTRLHAM